jgi:hypothetical protein
MELSVRERVREKRETVRGRDERGGWKIREGSG